MAAPFATILSALVSADVDFVMVGGFAVNAHGHRRATFDLDIIVSFETANVAKLVNCLKALGFSPRMPVDPLGLSSTQTRAEWQQRNMVVLSFLQGQSPYTVIDVFIEHSIDYARLVADSVRVQYDTVAVRICSVAHLIEMKERAGRGKDLLDLRFLYDILDQQKEGLK